MPSKKGRRFRPESATACVFCGKDENDEFLYGKFFHKSKLSAHQNCLFFASGLSQRGRRESDGILGFLSSDIQKEVLRGKSLRCFHCKRSGATVGCIKATCRRTFHFPCGIKNHSLHQFFGSFVSFCSLHKPVQKAIKTPKEEFHCHICFLPLTEKDTNTCLYASCCKKNWYHQSCLQQYAISAGRYFFKCPMCNNSSDFIKEMETYGICIPVKDASWELEENAFQELLERPKCGADECHCSNGRKFDGKNAWVLLSCLYCGSVARHRYCANLKNTSTAWKCDDCKSFEDLILKRKINSPNISEIDDGNDEKNSVNHQVCHFSHISEPSCSNISANAILSVSPNMGDVAKDEVKYEFEAGKNARCNNEKRSTTPELNSNYEKPCLTNNILNHFERDKMPNSSHFTMKYNAVKSPAKVALHTRVNVKKRKTGKKFNSPGCCSGHSQQCIRRMFGMECHNYRI